MPFASHESGKMEILCACDERYLPHAATMLCSLLEHNNVLRIHLLHSAIPDSELDRLRYLVAKYESDITFYQVTSTELEDLHVDKWVSIATYYRLLATRILPSDVTKILYLDSDIIVRHSLDALWKTDIADYAVAAVSNYDDDARKALGLPDGTKYFNAGVLLINLRFWRQNNVPARAITFARNNPDRIRYWDQDALNATLVGQWIELPACWNWQNWWQKNEFDPVIVHFIGSLKPWQWSEDDCLFGREYRKYRRKTPWRYKEENVPPWSRRISRSLQRVARATIPKTLRRTIRGVLWQYFR